MNGILVLEYLKNKFIYIFRRRSTVFCLNTNYKSDDVIVFRLLRNSNYENGTLHTVLHGTHNLIFFSPGNNMPSSKTFGKNLFIYFFSLKIFKKLVWNLNILLIKFNNCK